jgi:uncharacterized protein YjbJ (UPF0337 family)
MAMLFVQSGQQGHGWQSYRRQVIGVRTQGRGTIKDTAGRVTGDKKLESEGKLDKAKGSAHNVADDVKDAVKETNK